MFFAMLASRFSKPVEEVDGSIRRSSFQPCQRLMERIFAEIVGVTASRTKVLLHSLAVERAGPSKRSGMTKSRSGRT